MFQLTYRPKYDRDSTIVEYYNDINDIHQALINLVNDEKEERQALAWLNRAHFKDKVVRSTFGYCIECFSEEELKNNVENVVKTICNKLGLNYIFIGWDNDALTFDLSAGLSYIKYNGNYGYYIIINKLEPNGTCTELFSTTGRNESIFIKNAISGTAKALNLKLKEDNIIQEYNTVMFRMTNTLTGKQEKIKVSGDDKEVGQQELYIMAKHFGMVQSQAVHVANLFDAWTMFNNAPKSYKRIYTDPVSSIVLEVRRLDTFETIR